MSGVIAYRDVRPDGTVLFEWVCPEGQEHGPGYHPGAYPEPPWERQRREPGGAWVTVAGYDADGKWQAASPA